MIWTVRFARGVLVSLLVVAVMAGRPARAAEVSKENLAGARTHFEQGQRLYDLQRYPEAVQAFERAYQLSGDPVLLYNLAQSYRLANRYQDAIHYYELYLKKVPDSPRRAEIERRLVELQQAAPPPNQIDAPGRSPGSPGSAAAVSAPAPPPPSGPVLEVVPVAGSGTQPPGFHEHDGFYFHALLGPGYASLSADYAGAGIKISGTAGVPVVDIGYVVARNLAVYGEFFAGSAANPTVQVGSVSAESEVNMTISGAGVGAAYYVGDSNIFVSGSLVAVSAEFENNNVKQSTSTGFGVNLSAGKEWWFGANTGLGAAFFLHAGSMRDSGTTGSTQLHSVIAGVGVSYTFN